MKVVTFFLISFAVGYLGSLGYASQKKPVDTKVLAEAIEETPSPTPEPETPTPVPTPTETSKPTSKPKPSLAPTATPTPTPTVPLGPTSTPDVWSPPALEPIFARFAGEYGIDKNILERLANCESHFNPEAKMGDYLGMFQFATSTWKNYRSKMGLDTNPALRTNIEESIRTAAYVISLKGTSPWPKCV